MILKLLPSFLSFILEYPTRENNNPENFELEFLFGSGDTCLNINNNLDFRTW